MGGGVGVMRVGGGKMGLEAGIEVGGGVAGVGCMKDGLGVRGCLVGSGGGGRGCRTEAGGLEGGEAEGIEGCVDLESESIP